MTVYNTKEKGLEIRPMSLSSQQNTIEMTISRLEQEIDSEWNKIKLKRITIKKLRSEQRALCSKLNKELKKSAHQ